MKKANLFLIGAQKAGTTWLYKQLTDNPQIFGAWYKESHFFCSTGHCAKAGKFDISLYPPRGKVRYWIDCCVDYSVDLTSLDRIKNYNPDSKFLFIIRNPFERMASAINMHNSKIGYRYTPQQILKADRSIVERSKYRQTLCWLKENISEDNYLVVCNSQISRRGSHVEDCLASFLQLPVRLSCDSIAVTHRFGVFGGFVFSVAGYLSKNPKMRWAYDLLNRKVLKRAIKSVLPLAPITNLISSESVAELVFENDVRDLQEDWEASVSFALNSQKRFR